MNFLSLDVRDAAARFVNWFVKQGWEMPVGYDRDGAVGSLYTALDFEFDAAIIRSVDFDHGEERVVALGFIGQTLHVFVYVERSDVIQRFRFVRPTSRRRGGSMSSFDRMTEDKRLALKARVKADIDATSDAEDAEIRAAAMTDPDNPPGLVTTLKRRGRPPADLVKERVTLRLDPDVLARLRRDGPGWQTRANQLLRKAIGL